MPSLPTVPVVPAPPAAGAPADGDAGGATDEGAADGRVDGTVIPGGAADDDPDADDELGTAAGTAEPGDAEPGTVDEHPTASAATSSSATADAGARRRSGNRGTSEPYKAPPSVHGERAGLGSNPGIVLSHFP